MRSSLGRLLLLGALGPGIDAIPTSDADCTCATKPAAFFLAGDSTTAVRGGWGDGFLTFVKSPAIGVNQGHSGATTASFVAGGDWGRVLANVKNNTAKFQCIVTIQFGHNDQKEKAGISIQKFQSNLEKMAADVKAAGGIPVLLSSLTRRSFSGGKVADSLHNERLAAKAAAAASASHFADLNAASIAFVNVLGSTQSQAYNLDEGDRTHLNAHGGVVFGRMVADLLLGRSAEVARRPACPAEDGFPAGCLGEWLREDEGLSEKIWKGVQA